MSITKFENYQKSIESLLDEVRAYSIENMNAEEREERCEVAMILVYMDAHSNNLIKSLKKLQSTETDERALAELATIENNVSFMTCMDAAVALIMNPNSEVSRTISTSLQVERNKNRGAGFAICSFMLVLFTIVFCLDAATVVISSEFVLSYLLMMVVSLMAPVSMAIGIVGEEEECMQQTAALSAAWQTPSQPVKMWLKKDRWG